MEQQVQRGQEWLETLLELMGFPTSVSPELPERIPAETDSCWLAIETTNLTEQQTRLLIGDKGENIDAIQYLANTLLNLNPESEFQGSVTIEIDGYRVQRYQELITLAEQAVQQVRNTGQEVELTQLSSAERRQIHSLLQNSEDIQTESRGQEPDRRLVVRLRE
jgi:spoIIIJ-associated protein